MGLVLNIQMYVNRMYDLIIYTGCIQCMEVYRQLHSIVNTLYTSH